MAGVQGARLDDWQQPVARCIELRLQNLHRWLNHAPLLSETRDGHTIWKIPEHDDLVFDVDTSFQLRVQRSTGMTSGIDGDHFESNCKVYLTFKSQSR